MSLKWRTILAGVVLLGALINTVPNFVNLDGKWWPTKGKLVYGLDIQGGVHLVMGVDTEAVMKEKLQRTVRSLTDGLKAKEIAVKDVVVSNPAKFEVTVNLESAADENKAKDYLEKFHGDSLQIGTVGGGQVVAHYYDARVTEFKKQVLDQAIGVIRNRIDEFGVSEPSISAQGDNRVLVQLPGIKDSARAKDLINRTARLEFRIVNSEIKPDALAKLIEDAEKAGGYSLGKDGMRYAAYAKRINEDLKAKLPEATGIAFEKLESAATIEAGRRPLLLNLETGLGGDMLEDASTSQDEYGKPEVIFRLAPDGRRKFAEITGQSVGKNMAIVLDEVIQSAPVIQGKIDSDTARITLNQRNYQEALDEAKMIATTLRAGALPASLEQLEERSVGPTLGADSIARAKLAGLVAFAVTSAFMIFLYGTMGAVAGIALGLNVLCLLAVLTSLGATLTLPGIAGIILTMGMAVDANVIIYERIKEEFRKGTSIKLAIKDGFSHAYSAIIDANLVNAAVAIILFYYGTGPVRGFAVTLVSGIATSMFTAVFISRIMIDMLGDKLNLKRVAKA